MTLDTSTIHRPGGSQPRTRVCQSCQKSFSFERATPTKTNPGLYCSRRCASNAIRGLRPAVCDLFKTPASTKNERIRANGLINMRIKRGKVERPDACQHCGKVGRVDGHHPDYSRPDEVAFLCRSCHMKCHAHPAFESEVAAKACSLGGASDERYSNPTPLIKATSPLPTGGQIT